MDVEKIIPDIPDELKTEIYHDALKPAVSETGQVGGLLVRTLHNLMLPLEEWNLNKEYRRKELIQELNRKLEGKKEEELEPPEMYVALPAIQGFSYSMDNEVLRNLYANLLANAMLKKKKFAVHPAFAEIIKQMSPLDALMFKELYEKSLMFRVAIVDLRLKKPDGGFITRGKNITGLSFNLHQYQAQSIDNLIRLGLVSIADEYFTDDTLYQIIFASREYKLTSIAINVVHNTSDEFKIEPVKKMLYISDLGVAFYDTCVKDVEQD